jgi:hypothetical protein
MFFETADFAAQARLEVAQQAFGEFVGQVGAVGALADFLRQLRQRLRQASQNRPAQRLPPRQLLHFLFFQLLLQQMHRLLQTLAEARRQLLLQTLQTPGLVLHSLRFVLDEQEQPLHQEAVASPTLTHWNRLFLPLILPLILAFLSVGLQLAFLFFALFSVMFFSLFTTLFF